MANMTIKNIPDELYQLLKDRAKHNRRSINNEAIVCLERELRSVGRTTPAEFLASARESRERLTRSGVFVTEEDLRIAKEEGRP